MNIGQVGTAKNRNTCVAVVRLIFLCALAAWNWGAVCVEAGSLVLGVSIGSRPGQLSERTDVVSGQFGRFELHYQTEGEEVAGVQFDIERPTRLAPGILVGRFTGGFDSRVVWGTRILDVVTESSNLWRERVVIAAKQELLGRGDAVFKLGEVAFDTDFDSPTSDLVLKLRNVVWSDYSGRSRTGADLTGIVSIEAPELVVPPLPDSIGPSVSHVFTGISVDEKGVTVRFQGALGQLLRLERSSDFLAWVALAEFDGSAREWSFVDTSYDVFSIVPRFYRLVALVE